MGYKTNTDFLRMLRLTLEHRAAVDAKYSQDYIDTLTDDMDLVYERLSSEEKFIAQRVSYLLKTWR